MPERLTGGGPISGSLAKAHGPTRKSASGNHADPQRSDIEAAHSAAHFRGLTPDGEAAKPAIRPGPHWHCAGAPPA